MKFTALPDSVPPDAVNVPLFSLKAPVTVSVPAAWVKLLPLDRSALPPLETVNVPLLEVSVPLLNAVLVAPMVMVPPDWLVTGTWTKALLAVDSVVKLPPDWTVRLPEPPLIPTLPTEVGSRVSVPPASIVLGAPKVRFSLPAVPSTRTVGKAPTAPPTSRVLIEAPAVRATV